MMYTLRHELVSGRYLGVLRVSDGLQIPPDEANRDYREFLLWNSEQVPPLVLGDLGGESDEERVQRLASAAVMDTLARAANDPFAAAVVALFDTAFTLINDERELRGAPRLGPEQIFPAAIQALIDRQSAPAPP